MKKSAFLFILFLGWGNIAISQPIPPDSLYLGQTPPGNIPQVFAPGVISLPGRIEYGISISPAGDEMLFALGNWPDKVTMIMRYENNHWTAPDTVSFSANRSAEEAIYSPDGQRVYYYAYNPPNPVGGADLCYSMKNGPDWSEPVNLGLPLNSAQDEYHPYVLNLIPNQTAIKGELLTFTIPESTFIDDDGNNTLTYQARLTNGSPIPGWLTFDTLAGTFAGTPPITETLNIRVTATDTAGSSVSTTLKITVNSLVSTEQVNGQQEGIRVFPNPTCGLFNISLNSSPGKTALVGVYNLQGKAICTNSFRECIPIDMTGNPKGMYVIKLVVDNEITVRKICIQ